MGFFRHDFIIVGGFDEGLVAKLWADARDIFPWRMISPIVQGMANGYRSFFIGADGSKEGWEDSYKGDVARDKMLKCLESVGDGVNWCILSFPEDAKPFVMEANRRGFTL